MRSEGKILRDFRFKVKCGLSREQRLAELKRLADVIVPRRRKTSLARKRKAFDDSKDRVHPFVGANRLCFCCGGKAVIRHHIIQLQHGGSNGRRNIAFLCDPCHEDIHPWLKEKNLINVLLGYDADDTGNEAPVNLPKPEVKQSNGKPVTLTLDLINACRTNRKGFTGATVAAFGLQWRQLKKGWVRRLVGKTISSEQYETAVNGRTPKRKWHDL